MQLLLFIAALLPLCYGNSPFEIECDRIPPSLWCRNADLAKKCGFSESCDKYLKANTDEKLNLTVFFYSACGYSQAFIGSASFATLYTKLSDYVNVELEILTTKFPVSERFVKVETNVPERHHSL